MKLSKSIIKRIAEVQTIIDKAKKDEISAIEVDSTWETVYEFDKIELLKTRLNIHYMEWNGRAPEKKVDYINIAADSKQDYQDTNWTLSWIKRCIKKGYKHNYNKPDKD